MSFKINWPDFSEEFMETAKSQLTKALNTGKKPDNIHGQIVVTQLDMGTKPPDLEILEITELVQDRFKGIFKLVYHGDASIVVQTQVQANPLSTPPSSVSLKAKKGMLLAHVPLIVPMEMKISKVRLRGIVVLVVDKEKGITLVFKNDPLERVHVSSTFDNIQMIRIKLQKQIEETLRNLFQSELPQMIHNLSLLMLKVDASGNKSSPTKDDTLIPALGREGTEKNLANQFGSVPHHIKWKGNEPIYNSEYNSEEEAPNFVLKRSLEVGSPFDSPELGLRKIGESPKTPRKYLSTATDLGMRRQGSIPTRMASDFGYNFQVGLQGSTRNSYFDPESTQEPYFSPRSPPSHQQYLYPMQSFLTSNTSQQNLYPPDAPPALDFDMISVKSAPDPYGMSSLAASTIHKGQAPDGMQWHRPRHTSQRPTRPTSWNARPPVPPSSKTVADDSPFYRVVLSPSDNEVTAHLANLMTSHLTISPNTQDIAHLAFRGQQSLRNQQPSTQQHVLVHQNSHLSLNDHFETRSLPDSFSSYGSRSSVRRKANRRVHRIKIPIKSSESQSKSRSNSNSEVMDKIPE
ncbi:hypothetical protein BC833DRAFT_611610 [Globomyces pollinis-pini]|nr:hypothetical protein BC833DRAFT_611610 [Globomyces pollinis-pini]